MMLSFLVAAVAAASIGDCVPARWPSSDPASLALLDKSAVTCVIAGKDSWTATFVAELQKRGIRLLADVSDGEEAEARAALTAGADALYVEGDRAPEAVATLREIATKAGRPTIWLPRRMRMPLEEAKEPVIGTYQGLWAGVKLGHEGEAEAAPSGPPWIDTNSGFLRFVRAVTPRETAIWIANRPPTDRHVTAERYLQAIGDAAIAGAQWVVSLDEDFTAKLLAGDDAATKTWKRMNDVMAFYRKHQAWTQLPDYSRLAIIQDVDSGALVSGSVLDMVESKHIPAFVVPPSGLGKASFQGVKLLLNINPQLLTEEQTAAVRNVARQGAMLVNGPPQWKLALPPPTEVTFTDDQIKQLDEIWSEINRVIGRENFAVRLFGAPAMLSNLKATPDGRRFVLHLVNYSDYPVEAIAAHCTEKFTKATLYTPQGTQQPELYDYEEASGVDIDRVEDVAILVLEK